jgi:hypothetical protein
MKFKRELNSFIFPNIMAVFPKKITHKYDYTCCKVSTENTRAIQKVTSGELLKTSNLKKNCIHKKLSTYLRYFST